MSKKKEVRVNKKDINRVLVTETTPYEIPIIVSNDGFYNNVIKYQTANDTAKVLIQRIILGERKKGKHTIPYIFKINKNETEFRRLAFPHPISQIEMRDFYLHFNQMMINFCSQSDFSIRKPVKVASTYYYKNLLEDKNLYKRGPVDTYQNELLTRHASSYFGYHGYDRLYKFFMSNEFIDLERKYNVLYTLDVSKCFDSIYTHSISWATKTKNFTKGMLANKPLCFGDAFDKLMQRSNFNETHGVIIGPEISRIFAEVILQKIDLNVQHKLNRMDPPIRKNVDYDIRRYVDDVFIFSRTEFDAELIYKVYSDKLNEYNMHVNLGKVTKNTRPFITAKTQVIHHVNKRMNSFIDSFIEYNDEMKLTTKNIYNNRRLANKFIDEVKIICAEKNVGYSEVASYIVSAIFERIKRLVSSVNQTEDKDVYNAMYVLLHISLFFFRVAPSVSSSYKLASILIVTLRYFKAKVPSYSELIESYVYFEIEDFLKDTNNSKAPIDNLISLEAYNIMYVIGELDQDRYLPKKLIENVFREVDSYFDIVSCLYIIKNKKNYDALKNKIIAAINSKLMSSEDILDYSEKAMLFMDVMSCPYIDSKWKKVWLKSTLRELQEAAPSNKEIDNFISYSVENPWFVDWSNVDLLNFLEKKQLKKAY
ncbi:RNA-directed DNA polymerase [Serratia marcescens]|nr:RNA-directed DNA polymerase [Serratia marcescens]ELQ9441377.1 RNA-directed DNA polymerase [Serratia marcescens]ELT5561591.1 RNA-directed DNA polymerase [Serratia marcescens]